MRHLAAFVALLVLMLSAAYARAAYVPPSIQGAVTDTAGVLTTEDDRMLETRIASYRQRTGNELAVFIVGSLAGYTIEDVAFGAFNTWRIGRAGKDDGVLLVIAPNERKTRIETGKGIGDKITDLDAFHILRQRVQPLLKENRFRDAVEAGVEAIEAALDGTKGTTAPIPPRGEDLSQSKRYLYDRGSVLSEAAMSSIASSSDADGSHRHLVTFLLVRRFADATPELLDEVGELRLDPTLPIVVIAARERKATLRNAPSLAGVPTDALEARLTKALRTTRAVNEDAVRRVVAESFAVIDEGRSRGAAAAAAAQPDPTPLPVATPKVADVAPLVLPREDDHLGTRVLLALVVALLVFGAGVARGAPLRWTLLPTFVISFISFGWYGVFGSGIGRPFDMSRVYMIFAFETFILLVFNVVSWVRRIKLGAEEVRRRWNSSSSSGSSFGSSSSDSSWSSGSSFGSSSSDSSWSSGSSSSYSGGGSSGSYSGGGGSSGGGGASDSY